MRLLHPIQKILHLTSTYRLRWGDVAVNTRALIASQSIGTLASVYPATNIPGVPFLSQSAVTGTFAPPPPLAGHAFALPEYYAPCFPNNGSLLLIMFRISQNARNILANNPASTANDLTSSAQQQTHISDDVPSSSERKVEWNISGRATFVVQELPMRPSPVSRPRVALMGNVTLIYDSWFTSPPSAQSVEGVRHSMYDELESCYTAHHPDAKWWIPGKGSFHVRYFPLLEFER